MKKLFCLLLALLTIGGCALAETENKTDEAVLNIFTWEGYIDYSTVIKPFEEETGINQMPTLTLSGKVLPPSITFCVPVK